MNLSQAEIIQVLRRRANLNQGDFGAKAFGTSFESGRTKVKNLESGKQVPTAADMQNMARVLGVPLTDLLPLDPENSRGPLHADKNNGGISAGLLACFPGLEGYLDMLDKAICIGDAELIGHIAQKTAAIFSNYQHDARPQMETGTRR